MADDSEEEQSNSSFRPQATPPLTVANEEISLNFIKSLFLKNLNLYKTTLKVNKKLRFLKLF